MTAKKNENIEQSTTEAAEASSGVRSRRAIMLKQFLPNQDWINKEVVAKGQGTQKLVGRIFGVVTGYEDKTNTLPDGSVSASIAVKGMFQTESYLDGEVTEGTTVYFPMAFAEKIKATFIADETVRAVEVDTDIGIEATGKTIPYEWVVVSHVKQDEASPLARLKSSRGRPAAAPALEAPAEQKALPAE